MVETQGKSTLVLSTAGTEQSGIIPELALKNFYSGVLRVKQLPGLADIIEEELHAGPLDSHDRKIILDQFVGTLASQADTILLACTHYGVWYDEFGSLYPDKTIIDPSQEAAQKLVDYLNRHPEIESQLTQGATLREHWTKTMGNE